MIGLVVGKFCPLHLGHEALLQAARGQCERLVVLSYTLPEWPGCPAARREAWLRSRCPWAESWVLDAARLAALGSQRGWAGVPALPHDDAPAEAQRAFVAWFCRHVIETPVDLVFTSEVYGDAFAAALAEAFARPVRHLAFDPPRLGVPARAGLIRSAPWRHPEWLAAEVRASLVRRACVLGGESSGKTTLAAGLAAALGTAWVPEFGREHWHARGGLLSADDLLHIARTQVDREDAAAPDASGWLIGDTSPLSTLFYALDGFGSASAELHALAARHYDAVFVCEPDFAFVQDGTRRDEAFRQRQHAWTVDRLTALGMPFERLHGAADARLRRAEAVLSRLDYSGTTGRQISHSKTPVPAS